MEFSAVAKILIVFFGVLATSRMRVPLGVGLIGGGLLLDLWSGKALQVATHFFSCIDACEKCCLTRCTLGQPLHSKLPNIFPGLPALAVKLKFSYDSHPYPVTPPLMNFPSRQNPQPLLSSGR